MPPEGRSYEVSAPTYAKAEWAARCLATGCGKKIGNVLYAEDLGVRDGERRWEIVLRVSKR